MNKPEPITFNGKTQTLAQWARETGLNLSTIHYRVKKGWPPGVVLDPRMRHNSGMILNRPRRRME